jgi:hypothetical protein
MTDIRHQIERANSSESARAYSLAFSSSGCIELSAVEKTSERQRIDSRIFAFPERFEASERIPPLKGDSRFARSLGSLGGVLA